MCCVFAVTPSLQSSSLTSFINACDPGADASEIMVIQLLSFRRHCSKKCTACKYKIFSFQIFLPVYKEIFLLNADRRFYTRFDVVFPNRRRKRSACLLIASIDLRSWCLLIQRFSGIGAERSWNIENTSIFVFLHKRRRRRIPCSISAGFKCSPKSS